jgi:hypothetical protein
MSGEWDAQQVREWMLPAFEWVGAQWEANPEQRWEELKPGFLEQLRLGNESEFSVVARLFEWTATLSDEDTRTMLTTESQRNEALTVLIQRWEAETAAAAIASLQWVTEEQQGQLNTLLDTFGDWRQWLPGQLDDAWPDWRSSTAEVLAPWLNPYIASWVSPAPSQAAGGVPASDTAVPAAATGVQTAIDEIVKAILEEDGAEDLTEEEISQLIADVLKDQAAPAV